MEEIICVLDKSDSMASIAYQAAEGYNDFIRSQQEVGEANITVVWFNDKVDVKSKQKLSEVEPLRGWPLGGCTALYDAIGTAIDSVKERFTEEKPEKVIVAILTDGHENSSTKYSMEQVAELIKHHEDKYGWEVIFLAADQDAWATARTLNIKSEKSFDFKREDVKGAYAGLSDTVTSYRCQ